jgi:thioester reductase-like protein
MTAHRDTTEHMLADTHLDPEIQFPHPLSPHSTAPRAACLTGATGFLGGYLLWELMTTSDADAYCLVRGTDEAEAYARLVKHLTGYGLWQEAFRSRIHVITCHDLADRHFGMSDDAYRELATTVDVIYHSAGSLNMAFPYDRLRATNVLGTTEVLRLAGALKTKPVHFLSSMVVFFTEAHVHDAMIRESDAPKFHETLKGGYGKSKWVADRLVAAANERGLPTTIHRPVRTMGTAATGAMNDLTDILPLILKACVLIGKCPVLDIRVTMVPVDFVTRAMVHLAGRTDSFGKAFHYFHPRPIPWNDLMEIIRSLGYPLEPMAYADWQRALKRAAASRDEPRERREFLGSAFLAIIAPHFLFYNRPPMDAGNLETGLQGTDIVYPDIDTKLMRVYFDYWRKVGFVPDPPGAT